MSNQDEIYKLKINVDELDEMRDEDKKDMKDWGYDRCDIYLWQGNLCISSDYAKKIINSLNPYSNKHSEILEDLKNALNYKDTIGYQHLGLKKELINKGENNGNT